MSTEPSAGLPAEREGAPPAGEDPARSHSVPPEPPDGGKHGPVRRALDALERAGDKLPGPVILYLAFTALVMLASFAAARRGAAATHPLTGTRIAAEDLLSMEALRRTLADAVKTFVTLPRTGAVLVTMFGFGLAERTGFLAAALGPIARRAPGPLLTAAVLFVGACSGPAGDVGLVVWPPLAAILFRAAGRAPLAGLVAGFCGVTGGFGAGLSLTALDAALAASTEAAARAGDPGAHVAPGSTFLLSILATVAITFFGTLAHRWWVEPRLQTGTLVPPPEPLSPSEARALRASLPAAGLVALALVALVAPDRAPLRDAAGTPAPFFEALPVLAALFFGVPAAVHALARPREGRRSLTQSLTEAASEMGPYLLLAFVGAQLMAALAASNLAPLLALKLSRIAAHAKLDRVPAPLRLAGLAAGLGLFLPSASARWALLASTFVPLFVRQGSSPEAAEASFRAGGSVGLLLSPVLPFYPWFLFQVRRHRSSASVGSVHQPFPRAGTLLSVTLPYSAAVGVAWLVALGAWLLFSKFF